MSIFTFKEAAKYIDVGEMTLLNYVLYGKVQILNRHWLLKRKWGSILKFALFTKQDLDAYIAKRRKRHIMEGRHEEIRSLLDKLISPTEMARILGASRRAVNKRLKEIYPAEKLDEIKQRRLSAKKNRSSQE